MELVLRRAIADLEAASAKGEPVAHQPQEVPAEAGNARLPEPWRKVRLLAASRTDAGVHARGQVVRFSFRGDVPVGAIPYALNARLPVDVAVVSAEEVDRSFHPRYDAKSKVYTYTVFNRPIRSPLERYRALHVPHELDVEAMAEAARYFVGSHDFRAFMASGSRVRDTVRTVYSAEISQPRKHHLVFTVEADGFLYNMVRIMVGTLLEIGRGKHPPERVLEALQTKNRLLAGPTVPAYGLCLEEIKY